MIDSQASGRYARALFELAKESKKLDAVAEQFIQVLAVIDKHKEISHLVLNSTISRAEIESLIVNIFPKSIEALLLDFIKVVIKKSRFDQIHTIGENFNRLYENEKGIKEVSVITKSSLSSKVKDKLVSVLKKKLSAEIRLKEETNSEMLGGFILRFDGKEINTSYRDRLSEIKQILMA